MIGSDLENTISTYFRTRPEVSAVYLFGSFADGRQRTFSDVDVGILFSRFEPAAAEDLMHRYYLDLSRLLRKECHIVALNNAGERLLKQVFTRGKRLVENDARHLALFTMTAYAKIADFGYLRQRFESGFIRSFTTQVDPDSAP